MHQSSSRIHMMMHLSIPQSKAVYKQNKHLVDQMKTIIWQITNRARGKGRRKGSKMEGELHKRLVLRISWSILSQIIIDTSATTKKVKAQRRRLRNQRKSKRLRNSHLIQIIWLNINSSMTTGTMRILMYPNLIEVCVVSNHQVV